MKNIRLNFVIALTFGNTLQLMVHRACIGIIIVLIMVHGIFTCYHILREVLTDTFSFCPCIS